MEIVILLINVALCLWVGSSAGKKNRSAAGWFVLSLFVSPLLGGIILLISGEKSVISG